MLASLVGGSRAEPVVIEYHRYFVNALTSPMIPKYIFGPERTLAAARRLIPQLLYLLRPPAPCQDKLVSGV